MDREDLESALQRLGRLVVAALDNALRRPESRPGAEEEGDQGERENRKCSFHRIMRVTGVYLLTSNLVGGHEIRNPFT